MTTQAPARSKRAQWGRGIAEWIDGNTAYVSVVFTWHLQAAYQRCIWLASQGYEVRAGGPAVASRPDYLAGVAMIGGAIDALPHHNPDATVTSRGCARQCPFCVVPAIEGDLIELIDWQPKPIVCDNNLLACSRRHFDRVIDRLKPVPGVDFNQGLDARLLTDYHAGRLAELQLSVARVAWDHTEDEAAVMDALACLNRAGIGNRRIQCYVLIGFDDTPDDARYRLEMLRARGIWPNVMRYQPPGVLKRNEYVAPGWTDRGLARYCRFWNRQAWLGGTSFDDYRD